MNEALPVSAGPLRRLQVVGMGCGAVYALSLVFDGVIRWLLDGAGLAPLLYAREALPVVVIVCAWVIARVDGLLEWQRLMVFVAVYLSVWLAWGITEGIPPAQALFGLKTLLSIPVGGALWVLLRGQERELFMFSLFAGGLVLIGVIIDHFRDLPWAGLVYEVGDIQVEGQREWGIDGVARLGGFSRASFDAGCQMSFFAAIILASGANSLVRSGAGAAMLVGVLMTTSRSALLANFTVLFSWMILSFLKRPIFRLALLPAVWLPVLVVVAVFNSSSATDIVASMDRGGAASTISFAMRTEGNWQDALNMLNNSASWVMGLGMGGIGAAQRPFEPEAYIAPDNLLIYSLVSFGIIGSLVLFAGLTAAWFIALTQKCLPAYGLLLPVVGVAGMTISAVENPFIGMGLGLAFAEAFSHRAPLRSSS
jgi:hypothetical protein